MIEHRERSIQLRDGSLTGTPDLVRLYPEQKAILVIDYKMGFRVVERADVNLQTRAYAVMSVDSYEGQWEKVFVGLTQPRLSYEERVTLAVYTAEDIESARLEIAGILKASDNPKAKLVASDEACRYCKAAKALSCPAFNKAMTLPLSPITYDAALSKTAREAYLAQRLAEVSDDQLEKLMTAVSLAGMVKPFAWDEARKRIEAGTLTNFKLSKPSEKRDIVDPQRAIALLEMAGVATREAILSFCSVPLGKLEEAYRTAHPGLTWQDAKEKINKVLGSVIEKQELAPKVLRK